MTNIVPHETTLEKPFFIGLGSLVVASLVFAFKFPKLPPQVPLFYTKPWGESQLAAPYLLLLPIVISAAFLLVNTILSEKVSPFTKRILVEGAVLVCVLSSITVVSIVFLIA